MTWFHWLLLWLAINLLVVLWRIVRAYQKGALP